MTLILTTEDGQIVGVIHPGEYHIDAGPDFFSSRNRIDGATWSGNVEIHPKASDW